MKNSRMTNKITSTISEEPVDIEIPQQEIHEDLDDDEDMEFGDLKSRDSSMAFNKKDRLSSKGKNKTPTM